ncbi:unnamed protein product [Linum tenue]|uniref:Uncharacterized protein n=1 Tax=Linum tenue TaxID=586396 RepID=A0AAV0NWV7_9ROSI|nr:unnamed protein product [Linum tenue]
MFHLFRAATNSLSAGLPPSSLIVIPWMVKSNHSLSLYRAL